MSDPRQDQPYQDAFNFSSAEQPSADFNGRVESSSAAVPDGAVYRAPDGQAAGYPDRVEPSYDSANPAAVNPAAVNDAVAHHEAINNPVHPAPEAGLASPNYPAPTLGGAQLPQQAVTQQAVLPRPAAQGAPFLPVVETEYQDFYRAPRWQFWRPIVALLFALVLAFVSNVIVVVGYIFLGTDWRSLNNDQEAIQQLFEEVTPGLFLANNLGLAMLIPICLLVSKICYGQQFGWLHSVVGKYRWRWFGTCMAALAVVWAVYYFITWLIDPEAYQGLQMMPYTWLMIFGILLTTPFQAAGEEYGCRGLLNRSLASFVRPDIKIGPLPVGWLVGGVLSSLVFMAIHGASDPWLNLFYFSFGFVACFLVWKTGGLEAAIAMHVVNNLFAEATMPFTDFSDLFERSEGTGDWTVLIGIAFTIVGAIVVVKLAERQGIVTKSAPGRVEHAPAGGAPLGQAVGPVVQ